MVSRMGLSGERGSDRQCSSDIISSREANVPQCHSLSVHAVENSSIVSFPKHEGLDLECQVRLPFVFHICTLSVPSIFGAAEMPDNVVIAIISYSTCISICTNACSQNSRIAQVLSSTVVKINPMPMSSSAAL